MGSNNVLVVSNEKSLRKEIQEEVNSFREVEISFLLKYITSKYGCDCEYSFPRSKGGQKVLYCYLPNKAAEA